MINIKTFLILFIAFLTAAEVYPQEWTYYGPNSGPATDISIDQGSGTIFISTDPGGLFRSTAGITQYEIINQGIEFIAHPFANTVAIDPYRQNYVFAGVFNTLYLSTNNGSNWESASLIADMFIKKIIFYDNTTMFVQTLGSIYKSTDAGESFQALNINLSEVIDLEIDFSNSVLYSASTENVITSTDMGDTWSNITLPDYGFGIRDVNIGALSGDLYLVSFDKIFRTNDPIVSWEDITYDAPSAPYGICEDPFTGEVYLAGVDGFYKIGLGTWQSYSNGLSEMQGGYPAPIVVMGIFADPVVEDNIYCTTSHGVFYSSNSGSNWQRIGAPSSEVLDIEVLPGYEEKILIGGPRGNQIYEYGEWINTENYYDVGADSKQITLNPGTPDIIYSVGQSAWPSLGQIVVSTDGGETWPIWQQLEDGSRLSGVAVNPADPNIVLVSSPNPYDWSGMAYGIYRATDKGITETSFSGVVSTQTYKISAVAFDPAGTAYIADYNGSIFRSTDEGQSFSFTGTISLASDEYISGFKFKGSRIIAFGSAIRYSEDNGITWNLMGLENKKVVDLVYDPDNDNYIYAAVDGEGIYFSVDNGNEWNEFIPAIPNPRIYSMAVSQNQRKLYVGTLGGSLLAVDLIDPVPVEMSSFTADISGSSVLLNWTTATETNNYGFSVERKTGTDNFSAIAFIPGAGNSAQKHSYSFEDRDLSSGKYVYRLKQVDYDGSYSYSRENEIEISGPTEFALEPNYPNPFNPVTNINFKLKIDAKVKLSIFNVLGQEVKLLLNANFSAGDHKVTFDAAGMNSGIYLYKIDVKGVDGSSFSDVRKMTLLK